MSWWTSNTERLLREVIASQHSEIQYLRQQYAQTQERVDRLTEALSRKAGVDLILPLPPPIDPQPAPKFPNPWKDPNPVTINFDKGASL